MKKKKKEVVNINDLFAEDASIKRESVREIPRYSVYNINPWICRKLLWAKKRFRKVEDITATGKRRLICKILTFEHHWFKHYPGLRRYIRCRICGKLPKSQWRQLQKMRK